WEARSDDRMCYLGGEGVGAYRAGAAGRRPSEAEAAELLGVALPVLRDLDVEVEVHPRAEQGLDPAPGPGADLPQPRPSAADDDGLLGVPLDEQVDVDVEQRRAPLPARSLTDLLDDDGERVRQLVPDALERGLA